MAHGALNNYMIKQLFFATGSPTLVMFSLRYKHTALYQFSGTLLLLLLPAGIASDLESCCFCR